MMTSPAWWLTGNMASNISAFSASSKWEKSTLLAIAFPKDAIVMPSFGTTWNRKIYGQCMDKGTLLALPYPNALWAKMCARWLIGDQYNIFSITLFLMKYTEWKTFFCIFLDVMKRSIPNIDSFLLYKKLYEHRIQNRRNSRKSSEKYC